MTARPRLIIAKPPIAHSEEMQGTPGNQTRGVQPALPAITALVLGIGLSLLGPFEYPATAIFQIGADESNSLTETDSGASKANAVRQELASFMAEIRIGGTTRIVPLRWQIDIAGARSVAVHMVFGSRAQGDVRLRELVDAFLSRLKEVARDRRTVPSQGERILGEYVAQLEQRAQSASKASDAAAASLPASDSRIDRQVLLERWRILRGDLQSRRDQLHEANAELDRLKKESVSDAGIVTTDERRAAIESDAALTQDLRELTVNLTELKRLMQKINEDSSDALNSTLREAEQLSATLAGTDREPLDAPFRETLDAMQKNAAEFASRLTTFADAWRSADHALEQTSVDNQSSALLDQHVRLEKLLSAMLFDAGKRMSAIRSQISALEQSPADDARHHVLTSNVTRGFQALQASFHRFEFAAGAIDSRNSFRLDAALRTSRGLHRRTQEAISTIERTLAKQAGERAKKEHALATVRAEAYLAQLRAVSDQSIDQLLSTQDGINTAEDVSENFARAALRAELAAAHARAAQEDLDRARSQLQALTTQRMNSDISDGVTLASCSVDSRPSNLLDRVWTGALAAMCVFLTLFAVQFWSTRS